MRRNGYRITDILFPFSRWILVVAGVAGLVAGCQTLRFRSEPDIRVLVYNIHAGRDRAGQDNLERVGALIREVGADIVFLQEVDRNTMRSGNVDQLAELTRLTGLNGAFGKTLDYQGGGYGIAILSRWPITNDSVIRLPIIPPQPRAGGSYEPRGMLAATIAFRGDSIRVFNTHLDASATDTFRMQEATTVIVQARAADASGWRVLVAGDFNSTPESAVQEALHEARFVDMWEGCGVESGLTYPDTVPTKRIDYLFHLGRFECEIAEVLPSLASDHRAVLFVIRRR